MSLKVLIVDDNFVNRKILTKFIEKIASCDIVVNGVEALEAIRLSHKERMPYDLVLLDIMMPEMDGQETLSRIRAIEKKKGIYTLDGVKVIMVTAVSDPKAIMQAFRSGCESYNVKPVTRQSLFGEMRKLGLEFD